MTGASFHSRLLSFLGVAWFAIVWFADLGFTAPPKRWRLPEAKLKGSDRYDLMVDVYDWYSSLVKSFPNVEVLPIALPELKLMSSLDEVNRAVKQLQLFGDTDKAAVIMEFLRRQDRTAQKRRELELLGGGGPTYELRPYCRDSESASTVYLSPSPSLSEEYLTPSSDLERRAGLEYRASRSPFRVDDTIAGLVEYAWLSTPRERFESPDLLPPTLKQFIQISFEDIKKSLPSHHFKKVKAIKLIFGLTPSRAKEGAIMWVGATPQPERIYLSPLFIRTLFTRYGGFPSIDKAFQLVCRGERSPEELILGVAPYLRNSLAFVFAHELAHFYLETTDEIACDKAAILHLRKISGGRFTLGALDEILGASVREGSESLWGGGLADKDKVQEIIDRIAALKIASN